MIEHERTLRPGMARKIMETPGFVVRNIANVSTCRNQHQLHSFSIERTLHGGSDGRHDKARLPQDSPYNLPDT